MEMLSPRNNPPLHPEAPCQVNKHSFTLHTGVSGDFWGSQEGCQGPSRPSGRNRGPLPLRQTQRSPEGPRHLHRIARLSEAPWEVP